MSGKIVDERTGLTEEEAAALLKPSARLPTLPMLPSRSDSGPYIRFRDLSRMQAVESDIDLKKRPSIEVGFKWTF